ncbi:MAG: hypothetical protein BHV87_10745 [Clostridiales bacterium 36_14]|nr:MAG: hypothetical protein BHV87_10745 [Clostridiales bacterium 36_14]
MEIFKSIVTNVLTALYQPFWFAVLLTIFILFFYMYAYYPTDTGKGIKSACLAWIRTFKNSLFFRKLFCLVFFTVMILFRTLLNREQTYRGQTPMWSIYRQLKENRQILS